MQKETSEITQETKLELERQSKATIDAFLNEQVQEAVQYLAKNSPFYRAKFNQWNIDPTTIKSVADLQKIPFTTKEDLNNQNWDFLCVAHSKVVDYVSTSGTLGNPVIFALTDSDLDRLAVNEARTFELAGITATDSIQLMTTLDKRFMAGMAYFLGARKLSAGVVRVGSGVPQLHWDTINQIKPSTIVAVPSFILKLIDFAEKNGIDYQNSSVKKAICIGEPLREDDFSLNTLGKRIRDKWDIELYSTYASTEMSTAFSECEAGNGGHHFPDLLIPEFLDLDGNPVTEGELGELVITTLGLEAMPLLRFKTGDLMRHYSSPCSCGRNSLRVGPILGRKKQMIKLKGTSVYPPAIYDVLNQIKGITNYVVEAYTNDIGTDELLIHIGCNSHSDMFEHEIKMALKAQIRVTPKIAFLPVDKVHQMQFPAMSRKPILFVDNRR